MHLGLLFLSFSDAAKIADIARNLLLTGRMTANFVFFGSNSIHDLGNTLAFWTPPVAPFTVAIFFRIFGINDFSVIATSVFYYLLTLVFVYLLGTKIFRNKFVGILSSVAVGFNYDIVNYALSGASESPFFFEIVASAYFISLRRKWATVVGYALLFLMYFTRQQAFIYAAGLIFYHLILIFKTKRAILYFFGISAAFLLIDRFVLSHLVGKFFIYSITVNAFNVGSQYLPGTATSAALRGGSGVQMTSTLMNLGKKLFYDLYNFYKLLPQIINPYLFALFIIGIFKWGKDKVQNSFKIASIFIVLFTLLVVAASIPFFRYIHPIIPLVYIIAVGTLVEILSYKYSKKSLITISTFLILFFGVGQTLGIFLLDSRFVADTHNVGKPPVYAELAYKLRDNTTKNEVVLTNLDTWGTWYGERKTVWFPLTPNQIIDPKTGKIPFDAIYLTSYLIDDQNYYMGADWREIFNNPTDSKKWICDGCGEIAKEFTLKGIYKISASEDYERQDASAILLIKK